MCSTSCSCLSIESLHSLGYLHGVGQRCEFDKRECLGTANGIDAGLLQRTDNLIGRPTFVAKRVEQRFAAMRESGADDPNEFSGCRRDPG